MATRTVRAAILCSFNLDLITQELVRKSAAKEIKIEAYLSSYGQWETDVFNPNSKLYGFAPEVVILFLEMTDLLPPLSSDDMLFRADDSRRVGEAAWQRVENLVTQLRSHLPPQSVILIHTLVPTTLGRLGTLEGNDGYSYQAAAEVFNASLRLAAEHKLGLFVYDQVGFVSKHGWHQLVDPRLWHLGRMRLSRNGLNLLAEEYARYLAAIFCPRRKCLVLDLDNTLWGGVIGEDDLTGIQIGHQGLGLAHREFQMAALALWQRGIILAISSKNNPPDALDVLDKHPDMVLRQHHFACMEIGWNPKPNGLRNIARRLNIGLDSLVFWDDSPVERDLVRSQVPEILVPEIPSDVSGWVESLLDLDCFDVLSLTEEDRRRGELYRQQIQRDTYLVDSEPHASDKTQSDYEGFLRSLAIVVSIQPASEVMISRLAQLTQRTNQFNFTTRRYGEQELRGRVEDPRFRVFGLSAQDRFGDLGLVGAAILEVTESIWSIDTFLMSCRALGRGIEDAFLEFLASEARSADAELTGEFVPTAKNAPAHEFLTQKLLLVESHETSRLPFRLDTDAIQTPGWVRVN